MVLNLMFGTDTRFRKMDEYVTVKYVASIDVLPSRIVCYFNVLFYTLHNRSFVYPERNEHLQVE